MRRENIEGDEVAYRAYEVNEKDRIVTVTIVTAASEDEAVEQARGMALGRTIELWDRGRLIARFAKSELHGLGLQSD